MLALNSSPSATAVPGTDSLPSRGPICENCGKRLLDLAVALCMATVALPLIAVMWVLVRATSPGPGFYSQVRVGRGGSRYRIYKIRTMRNNCEAGTGAQWAKKGDSRVTRIGSVLRKLHLDELPQLWNVLRGDMSLVGPRPERPEFVGPLSDTVQGYTERLRVRPGVTGLAQIRLPADSDLESVRLKVVLDHHYVENATLWLDLRILMGTVVYLIGFPYPLVRRAVLLPNPLANEIPMPPLTNLAATKIHGPVRITLATPEPLVNRVTEQPPQPAAQPGPLACGETP